MLDRAKSGQNANVIPSPLREIALLGTDATIDWKADPYTYQTLEVCTNLAVPVPPWKVLKAYSPPSNPTNRFIDSLLLPAAYYRVRAE